MGWVVLATEDELSEQIGIRLATEAGLEVGQRLRRDGFGYLKKRMINFCQMAIQQPVLLITDLDQRNCPSALIANWLGTRAKPPKLLFRVAVREIESWLLADHVAMRALFGNRIRNLPIAPDTLADPKQRLLSLAKHAPQKIRSDLLPEQGAVASQGLGYNARLSDFVRNVWQPERAATRSPSLDRARVRFRELSEQLQL
jgi:hypothetical protein